MGKIDVTTVSWNWSNTKLCSLGAGPHTQGATHPPGFLFQQHSEPQHRDADRWSHWAKEEELRSQGCSPWNSWVREVERREHPEWSPVSECGGHWPRVGQTVDSRGRPSREQLPGDLWAAGLPTCLQSEWIGPAELLGRPAGLQKGYQWEDMSQAQSKVCTGKSNIDPRGKPKAGPGDKTISSLHRTWAYMKQHGP